MDLSGQSLSGWNVTVDPSEVEVQPSVPTSITVSVDVPMSPTFPVDIERTTATGGTPPSHASAYLITIAGRHVFTDLPASHWADDPVQYLVSQGVVSGYADGTFHPESLVTRAQFAKVLVGAMGWTVTAPDSPTFNDVAP